MDHHHAPAKGWPPLSRIPGQEDDLLGLGGRRLRSRKGLVPGSLPRDRRTRRGPMWTLSACGSRLPLLVRRLAELRQGQQDDPSSFVETSCRAEAEEETAREAKEDRTRHLFDPAPEGLQSGRGQARAEPGRNASP